MFIGGLFTACEPMEEIHEEVDASLADINVEGDVEYVMTEDDYDALDVSDNYFKTLDDARGLIPNLLSEKFPMWGKGSLASVTFNVKDSIILEEYTVTESDYAAIGLDVDYFSDMDEITEFLSYQYPQASNGDYVELTYRTIPVEIEYQLDDDDFDLIGTQLEDAFGRPASSAAQYGNFDRREGNAAYWSNEMILEALNVVLSKNFEDIEGQTYSISYEIYDGSSGVESMDVMFDGSNYVIAGATPYELSADDFDLIGDELGEAYPEPAGNAAQYNSFGVVEDSDTYWSDEMILEALNVVLMERFPSAGEGAEFVVDYRLFTGSGTEPTSTAVVLSGGEYVIDDTPPTVPTIMDTSVFVFTNGSWDVPLALPSNIYRDQFGQRFANFDNVETAGFYISRYMQSVLPYAEEGDFISVGYNFYNGSGVVTNYANFLYEDGVFNFIPDVVPYTMQFGHNGTTWEPDNTIVYIMMDSDYETVSNVLGDKYDDPAWSAGNYGNFDRRKGNRNYWSDAMLLEAINAVLNDIAPNAEEGQKYVVYFQIYNGSAGTESLSVIKQDGEWVLNE